MAVTARRTRTPDLAADLGLARLVAIGGVVLVAVALQSTVLARLTLLGVIPQLVLIVVVSLAFLDGSRVGLVAGFAGGLLQDLLLPQSIVGLTALVYTLVGYGVGSVRQFAPTNSVWSPVIAVAIASGVAELGYAALAIILGQPWVSLRFTAKVTALVVLYDTLLTPFTFPLLDRIAARYRPEKVYRW